MKSNFSCQILILFLICLFFLVQTVCAEDVVAAQKINEVVCIFIYLFEAVVGSIASIVIVFMGLKYLTSGNDPDGRYLARTGIIGAFAGIIIVAIAVPVVNIISSGLLGTVDCGFFPSISGGGPAGNVPVAPAQGGALGPIEKSPDIAAKGLLLTKSLEDIKTEGYAQFPIYFQLANIGSQSSPGFMNTVSMMAGTDLLMLCNTISVGLPADSETFSYPCSISDMSKVKEALSSGESITLILKVDSASVVADSNRGNNELSMLLSDVPVKKIDEKVVGDTGGIAINYVKENP